MEEGPGAGVAAAGLRVAVIGARRARQGTGPFLAAHARAAGAAVVAVATASAVTAAQAVACSAEQGWSARGYDSAAALFAAEDLDAVIVATPARVHGETLREALAAGLHVLCEKPLLAPGEEEQASALAADFAGRGRILAELCQWPYTLEAFRRLHPERSLAQTRRFTMRMAPPYTGRERWLEILSHPLSLLQAALPGVGRLQDIRYPSPARLSFRYQVADRNLACSVEALETSIDPRPADYAFDEAWMVRQIEQPGYRFFFADQGGRRVAAPDPAAQAAGDFLRRVAASRSGAAVTVDETMVLRQGLLSRLLAAWEEA